MVTIVFPVRDRICFFLFFSKNEASFDKPGSVRDFTDAFLLFYQVKWQEQCPPEFRLVF